MKTNDPVYAILNQRFYCQFQGPLSVYLIVLFKTNNAYQHPYSYGTSSASSSQRVYTASWTSLYPHDLEIRNLHESMPKIMNFMNSVNVNAGQGVVVHYEIFSRKRDTIFNPIPEELWKESNIPHSSDFRPILDSLPYTQNTSE